MLAERVYRQISRGRWYVPAEVMADLMGLPTADRPTFLPWSVAFMETMDLNNETDPPLRFVAQPMHVATINADCPGRPRSVI